MAKTGAKNGTGLTNLNKLNNGDYRDWLKSAKRAHAGQKNMAFAESIKVNSDSPQARKFEYIVGIDGKKVKRYLN